MYSDYVVKRGKRDPEKIKIIEMEKKEQEQKMTTWYKIVEKHPDGFKTLFHGNNGSRLLETDVWLEANIKTVIDGSGGKRYLSGWHVLKNHQDAVDFLKKFRKRKELLYIVPCKAKNIRVKPSNKIVFLAQQIKIVKE